MARPGERHGFRTGVPGGNGRHPELIKPGLRNHFVYWVWDADGQLLYIGCTRRPEVRWKEHLAGSSRVWARRAARRRMAGPYDYPTARRIEREQQLALNPQYGHPLARPKWHSQAAEVA